MSLKVPAKKRLTGLFLLAICCLFSQATANIEFIFAFKEKNFTQYENNTAPDLGLWSFKSGAKGDTLVTEGTIAYPGSGAPVPLSGELGDLSLNTPEYTSVADLNAEYPNGQFTLSIIDDGTTMDFGPFDITGDEYPAPAIFLNLDALAIHDVTQDFQIEWSPFSNSGSKDRVIIQIFEPTLEEDVLLSFLPNDSRSYRIPGGTLKHGFSYEMGIFFLNTTNSLDTPESIVGYITSTYTSVELGSLADPVTIPDNALRQAIKLELNILPENDVTYEDIFGLNSLVVTSGESIDLSGLQHASNLSQLTLNTEALLNVSPVTQLSSLESVKLRAPQKEGLFFTHWSDGSQENPRIIENTGSQDIALTAQYSAQPLSPYAGGFTLTVKGTVALALSLPPDLDVQSGDPYELRFNYLIYEDALSGGGDRSASLSYRNDGRIAMEAEVRINDYRWILRSTNEGMGASSITTTSLNGLQIFEFRLSDTDGGPEFDFPFSTGTETISFTLRANLDNGELFNGPLKIPDDPGYLNWDAVTGGSSNIQSGTPAWLITLSTIPGPNQSYRLERHPSYLDLTEGLRGYPVNAPTVGPGSSTEFIEINWTDNYSGTFETRYEVWRGNSDNLTSTTLIASDLFDTTFRDSRAIPGRDYHYWIRAVRDGLRAEYSQPAFWFRNLSNPEDVQATQGDFSDRIRVTWTRVSGASSYAVYRSTANNLNTAQLLQANITNNEYADLTPDTDNTYFYWVTSKAFSVSSDFSDPASGYKVANGITSLSASDGLYDDRVRIDWDTFPGATGYVLYRNTVNDSSSATTLAIGITDTQYDDLLSPENQGVTYYYWVRHQIGVQQGSLSNTDPGYIPVQRDTSILAWGDNDFDQTNIPDTSLMDIVAVAAGANHSLALTADETVVGWGRNEFGQATPPQGLSDVIDIAVGYDHSLALKRDGTVVSWGRNTYGKATVPDGLVNVIDIEAGAEHSLALLSDGRVVGWGGNDFGQITIPETLNQVVQISAGGYHNLASLADGSVVTWGDNRFGQQDIPERITGVIDISAGSNHNLVILTDGTVDGWGDNSRGQLEFPTDTQTPPQAKGLVIRDPVTARIVDISGGLFHSLALSAKGELSAWGEDKNSQTKTPKNLGIISQIDAGDEFNLVVGESPLPKIESLIPSDSNLLSGEDVVLKVRATGGPDISYQWFFNDTSLTGATSEVLLLSDIAPTKKGSYSVKVTSVGNEVSSSPILIDVTQTQATITTQTVRAIRTFDGTYLFSPVETSPPGLRLSILSPDTITLPKISGTHTVSIDVDQQGFSAAPTENVTLELDVLDDKPLRLVESDGGTSIRYFAPEGFSSTLQSSTDMREWVKLTTIVHGDGAFYDFLLTAPEETFYRVVFNTL